MFGSYNFENIQTAYALGRYFGITSELAHQGIAAYAPKNNRSQVIHQQGNLIILDAYNANPSSMEAALESFASLDTELPKMAILGDMLELGSISEEEHLNLLHLSQKLGIETLLCGPLFIEAAKQVKGFEGSVFEEKERMAEYLSKQELSHAILIKGSRGMKLETLLPFL